MKPLNFIMLFLFVASFLWIGQSADAGIWQENTKGNGSVEIAGPSIGLEFHRSRPVPSRISFFEPVANSIDIHHDGWTRDSSMVFRLKLEINGKVYRIEDFPFTYEWTPFSVRYKSVIDQHPIEIEYHFYENQPVAEMTLVVGTNGNEVTIVPHFTIATVLRTCHSYQWRQPDFASSLFTDQYVVLNYPDKDTDSAQVLIWSQNITNQWSTATYETTSEYANKTWLILSTPQVAEKENQLKWKYYFGSGNPSKIEKTVESFKDGVFEGYRSYEERIMTYANDQTVFTHDPSLMETATWSRAALKALQHPLEGEMVPMPCPAEYNFYFTHDALVTDLSATMFDLARLKKDLEYIHSKTKSDSIIPHAYYWRDGEYITEYCGPENWNHYWFIQVVSSYMKHGGDRELVMRLLPSMSKSVQMILSNRGEDGLIHGKGPDWWDAGNVPGARSYHSSLAIRTLREYFYLMLRLGREDMVTDKLLADYRLLNEKLEAVLWDEDRQYLMNLIGKNQDDHYYCGSLVAGWFNQLDEKKRNQLINTAKSELLDSNLGIRVAMPPDFHILKDEFKFNGMEMGEPWMYFNGAVWPNSSAWYINALIYNNRLSEALDAVKNYMTLAGTKESPNGQPSFYEFRYTNPESENYGKIYKPNFLWAGGWYLYALYGLAGVRENAENVSLTPDIPWDDDIRYNLIFSGNEVAVNLIGSGQTASKILVDSEESYSLVLYGNPDKISIERGKPTYPYLAKINTILASVNWDGSTFFVDFKGIPDDYLQLTIISPVPVTEARAGDKNLTVSNTELENNNGFRCLIEGVISDTMRLEISFNHQN